jgi:hypothetical protein
LSIWRCLMEELISPLTEAGVEGDPGCSYVVDDPKGRRICGNPRRQSSSYCAIHHSLCYIAAGSTAEFKLLREVEALASAVGGRRGQQNEGPTRRFLARLERAVRTQSCV